MDTFPQNASGRLEAGARLRPCTTDVNCSSGYGSCLAPPPGAKTEGDAGRRSRATRRVSETAPYPFGDDRPTSPAFMRLLSQRSPRNSSRGNRSSFVSAQLSARRRVSSPTVAARAWLGPAANSPAEAFLQANSEVTTDASIPFSAQNTHKEQGCRLQTSCRGKFNESSSEQRCQANPCPLRRGKKELRRKKSGASKDGASLTPVECERQESSSNSSRPPPRVVMSPRHFPPPTFEKILLGLNDADFIAPGGETDVFGGSIVLSKPEVDERKREEPERMAMPVDTPGKEEASASVSPTSPMSQASLMGYRTDSHEDGVIPNHYLYIPPLRLEVLTEGKRPVPFLQQAAEDDAQNSVRGDRRHIATLFSLEAAESQAQISRLQEQLKATRPFRLRDVGDPSVPMNEGLQAPPGKSKRRHRSTVLETIVRQHDWQLQESGTEGNSPAPHGQPATPQVPRQTAELADNAAEPAALSSDEHLDYSGRDGSPPVSSGVASADEDSPGQPQTDGGADQDPAAFNSRSDELGHPALPRMQEGCVGDQREDVPGAFDAVWGRCEGLSQTYQEAPSYGTPSESGECQQDGFVSGDVSERLNRMAEFLEAASLLREQNEKLGLFLTVGPCNDIPADSPPHEFDGNLKESTLVLGGEEPATSPGGVAMLSLGDSTQWEVRYSTVDSFPSSAEHSPITCKELNASDEDAGELQEGNDEEKRRETGEQEQGETGIPGLTGEGLTGPVPQEPPASAGSHRDASAGHTGPHRLSSSRLFSSDRSETTILPYGSPVEAVSDISRCVTKEPHVGAALHQRFLSLQSSQSEETEDHVTLGRCDSVTSSDGRQSVSRKRQRTPIKQETPVMNTLMPVVSVWRQEEWTGTAVNSHDGSAVHTLTGDPAGSFCSTFRRMDLQRQRCLPAIADLAESPVPVVSTHTKMYAPLSLESGPQAQLPPGKLQLAEGTSQDEVLKKDTAPPSEEIAEDVDEHQTSPSFSGSLCEAASPETPKLRDNGQQCHRLPPTSSLSVGAIEATDWATGGCAYGAGLHATLVGSALLAICGLLTVSYMFEEGRGVRFFVSCAVALSFVLALSLGLIQLAASLLKWRGVKCGIDSDVREALLFSLKCLSPAPDAEGPSADASEESGQQLQLVCDHFVNLVTRGSPCLDVSCILKKRFGWTSLLAGLGGAGLVAVVQCSVQWQDKQSLSQIQTADVAAIGAALAYSVLLLVLSLWLASPPTRGAVKRAVEQHAAFQYLWTLTFVDFLVDKGAVTAKSAEDIRTRFLDELPRRCPQYLIALQMSFCGQKERTATVSVREPRTFMSKFMTARIIWHLPNGTSLRALKNFRVGQRALLGFAAAPLRKEGPGEASAPAYLKLVWYCSRALPEELLIPIGFESITCDAEGKMQPWQASALGKQAVPNVESAATHRKPSEVIQFILGLLQGEPKVSFLSSQIRGHVCEPVSLSSASCEYSLFLRIPVRSIRRGLGSERGAWLENKSSPFAMRRAKKEAADMGAAVRNDGKKAVTNESSGIVAGARETCWTAQRPHPPAVPPHRPFSMHITTKEQLNTSAKAESNAVQLGSNEMPEEFALVALMFASEEQREEFYGCLEEVLCA